MFVIGESTNIRKEFASHLPRREDTLQRKLKSGHTDKSPKAGRSPRAYGRKECKRVRASAEDALYFNKF